MKKALFLCCLGMAGLGVAITGGCSKTGSQNLTLAFENVEGASTYRLQNSAREFGAEEDILFTDSANLIMPTALYGKDVAPLRDSIMRLAFDTIGSNVVGVMGAAQHRIVSQFGYPAISVDTVAGAMMPDGFYTVIGTIANLTPDMLVYCVNTQEYRPRAAHGMGTSFYINYSLNEGRVLSYPDIFDENKTEALVAAIQTQADALEQLIGPTTIEALPAGNNFMISPDGEIVFVYQPYEVASYAQGTIRVAFYPYELFDYLTPYAIELFKLGDIGR